MGAGPSTGYAIQLQSDDCHLLGWAPRYLVEDLVETVSDRVTARVVRINDATAPLARRILVEMTGYLPPGKSPMAGPDFKPIVSS